MKLSVSAQKVWQIFKAVGEQKRFSLGPVRAPRHLFLYKMSFFRHYVFSNFLRMDRLYDIVKFVKFDSGAKLSWCQIVLGPRKRCLGALTGPRENLFCSPTALKI